ncbi:MAG: methylaspartate mutase subunit S, partial [Hafnia alvei]
MQNPTIVIGVIGADCHAVGNKVLDRVFTMHDFNVINLGVMVSQDEYIDAAIETGAQAIVVSSIYGHGEVDCIGMRENCIERGIGDILLYVGGNLVIGKHDFCDIETKFK